MHQEYAAGTHQIHQDGTAGVSGNGGALQECRVGECPCRERSKDESSKGLQRQGGPLASARACLKQSSALWSSASIQSHCFPPASVCSWAAAFPCAFGTKRKGRMLTVGKRPQGMSWERTGLPACSPPIPKAGLSSSPSWALLPIPTTTTSAGSFSPEARTASVT